MFVLRSAFWLTVAFIALAPKNVDLGSTAQGYSDAAMAAGQKLIVSQIISNDCQTIQCAGGKAALQVLAGPISPSIDAPMQDSSNPVPLPRPRPDRMG